MLHSGSVFMEGWFHTMQPFTPGSRLEQTAVKRAGAPLQDAAPLKALRLFWDH